MSSRYPTPHKFDRLGSAGKRLARVPRYGRLIALLPPARFDRLHSEAATFWEVYSYVADDPAIETGVLDGGLRAAKSGRLGMPAGHVVPACIDFRKFQVRLACDVLGAVAFEMYVSGGSLRSASSQTHALRVKVVNRLFAARVTDFFDCPIQDKYTLSNDLDAVFAMDAHELKYFIFSAFRQEIRWTDITTQAFFAAYWVSRWGSEADCALVRNWVPDPILETNEEYREFWSFVAEMPAEAVNPQRWESLLAPLYDGSLLDAEGLPIRSTELIYRSWDGMKNTAAGRKFRSEFRRLMEGDDCDPERVRVAHRLVWDEDGTSQFLSLGEGARGPEDRGAFTMGAPADECPGWDSRAGVQNNPLHRVRLSPYRLHRYCVTNEQYELFDRRHVTRREFAAAAGDVSRHPVMHVSWYDAWCFASWVGEIELEESGRYTVVLPSEAQWEYACRAGQTTPFTWQEGQSGEKCESAYCNFAGTFPWGMPGTEVQEGVYRERTIRVDGVDEDGTQLAANRWGFHQLHGNVWEWCIDWYGADYYRMSGEDTIEDPVNDEVASLRVGRGGGWYYVAWFCRSALRYGRVPAHRDYALGFRVAAVPPGKSSQPASGAESGG